VIQSTKGWNWGKYELGEDRLHFEVGGQPCFVIPYRDIAIANVQTKNEVSLEFKQEESAKEKGDMLCEMRFLFPHAEGEVDEEDQQESAAQRFRKVISDKAQLDDLAGDSIASVKDLPFIIPRGKYSLDFSEDTFKMHGTTHDYKVNYRDIEKAFALMKPDGKHMALVIQLRSPLRQG